MGVTLGRQVGERRRQAEELGPNVEIDTTSAGTGGEARRHLETLNRRRWFVVVPLILGLLAAVYLGRGSEDTFVATAIVRVPDPSQNSVFGDGDASSSTDTDRLIASAIQLIRGDDISEDVAQTLKAQDEAAAALEAATSDPTPQPDDTEGLGDDDGQNPEGSADGIEDEEVFESFDKIETFDVLAVSETLFINIRIGSLDGELAGRAARAYADSYIAAQGALDSENLTERACQLRRSASLIDGEDVEEDCKIAAADGDEAAAAQLEDEAALEPSDPEADAVAEALEGLGIFADSATLCPNFEVDPVGAAEVLASLSIIEVIDCRLDATEEEIVRLEFEIRAQEAAFADTGTFGSGLVEDTIERNDFARRREILLSDRSRRSQEAQFFREEAARLEIEATFRVQNGARLVGEDDPTLIASRSLTRDLVVFGMLGAMLGVALALAREYFDSRIKSVADLQDLAPGVPIVGAIPRMGGLLNQPHLAVSSGHPWYAAEAYRSLRTTLLAMHGRSKRSFVFSSVGASAGKSVTVTNLAVSLANAGFNTLVIDANLRRPSIHMKLGVENHTGVAQLLAEAGDPAEFIRFSHLATGLDVLPAGAVPENPSELVGSQRMTQLIEWAEMRYDYVLVDSPPLDVFTDAAVVAHHLGGVFVVVRFGATEQPRLLETMDQLATSGVPVLGLIVNGRDPDQSRAMRYARRIGSRNLKTLWTDRPSQRRPVAPVGEAVGEAARTAHATPSHGLDGPNGSPIEPRIPGHAANAATTSPAANDQSQFAPNGPDETGEDGIELLVRERLLSAQELATQGRSAVDDAGDTGNGRRAPRNGDGKKKPKADDNETGSAQS